MKTTTLLTSFLILAALTAFIAGPVTAEDEPPPRQPAPSERDAAGDGPPARGPLRPGLRQPDRAQHHAAMSFRGADANRDGRVSADEWKSFQAAQDKAFQSADKDGDGALSKEEMPRRPLARAPRGRGAEGAGRRGPPPPPQEGRADRPPPPERRDLDGPPPARGGPAGREPEEGRRPHHEAASDRPARGQRIERLTAALENLLEQLESRPPR